MNLITKFNLILLITFAVGLATSSLYSYKLTQDNALTQVTDQAELIMQEALAIRSYTVNEVRPLLGKDKDKVFHPQTVPAYSATQTANLVRKKRPEYAYKEAVFSPTNPRDKAEPWEEDIINRFIKNSTLKKQVGSRETAEGKSLYFAYPIKITNEKCLACHSTPDNAPKPMLAIYGDKGGFGWKLNEVVGTQIVSVPFKLPAELAKKTLHSFIISLSVIFLALFIVLNILIRTLVLKPVAQMTNMAEDLSKGDTQIGELAISGNDEIAKLALSFNRMRRSVIKIVQLLKKPQ